MKWYPTLDCSSKVVGPHGGLHEDGLAWVSDEQRRSNQSVGKGNPKSNKLGLFFHIPVAHGVTFPQIITIFQSHSPEVHYRSKPTSAGAKTKPPNRTRQKILLVTATRQRGYRVVRAQHQSPARKDLAPNHTVSQRVLWDRSGEELAQCEERRICRQKQLVHKSSGTAFV